MKTNTFIGIDVSKDTIDVAIYGYKDSKKFSNDTKGFEKMLRWIESITEKSPEVFCFEATGLYSLPLSCFLQDRGLKFCLVSGLMVKRSSGIKRGKSDRTDAMTISRYAYLHREELRPSQVPSKSLLKLNQLFSLYRRMVKQRAGYIACLKEQMPILPQDDHKVVLDTQRQMIELFTNKIKLLEEEMLDILGEDESLKQNSELLRSIKGIGLIVALYMIIITNNFTRFDNWRQFACYCGIVPFEHSSGISYQGRTRVSHLANKQMKTLLSNAAATAIQFNAEMKDYFHKRVSEGKNKMAVLNIIRNKLVSRAFAVINRQSPYVDLHKFAA